MEILGLTDNWCYVMLHPQPTALNIIAATQQALAPLIKMEE